MTDTATTTAPTKTAVTQPENPIILESNRNDVTLKLQEARTVKGRDPGKIVFDVTDIEDNEEGHNRLFKWFGTNNLVNLVKSKIRQATKEIAEDCVDEDTGVLDQNAMLLGIQNLDVAGETIGDLKDELSEKQSSLVKLDLSKAATDPSVQARFLEIGAEIQRLCVAIEKKSKKKKAESNGAPVTA